MKESFNQKDDQILNLSKNLFYTKNEFMEKLFTAKKFLSEKKNCENEKIINPLFIKTDKCFVITRSPLSPYITEKVSEFFIIKQAHY